MHKRGLLTAITSKIECGLNLIDFTPISGGSINYAYILNTKKGNYFVKLNNANSYPNMFKKEAEGLALLKECNCIDVPFVICTGEVENTAYLVLNYIEQGKLDNNYWETFGIQLANLHKNSANYFGLLSNNYIGSLHQSNTIHYNWIDFFIEERLEPQIKMAFDKKLLYKGDLKKFNRLFIEIAGLFPTEKPALLHGDLWRGNLISNPDGNPCLIDPAVYYGNREMDIAMTKLFGGFNQIFYFAYNSEYPLQKGWEDRIAICNLYPLLVHANLFGKSYVNNIQTVVNNF